MPESSGAKLAVMAKGKLTDADYKQVWIPKLEELINKFGKIRAVVFFTKDFEGWELHAAWDDASFGLKHRNDFEKIAVVGAGRWVEWGTKLGSHLMSGEVKTFSEAQLPEALAWAK
jgi:hypothetical protein